MEDKAVALRVLIAAAKAQPHNAPALWQAARLVLNGPVANLKTDGSETKSKKENDAETKKASDFPTLQAEFDYLDENGLHTHRTIYVMGLTDGRDIKRNSHLPVADRYGYLLTGYCTLRKQIRSFRSSRISHLRTFVEGQPLQANRQWREPAMAS
jgi:hypothetical protein